MRPTKKREVEKRAEQMLRDAGIRSIPVEIMKIAEHLGIRVVVQPLEDEVSGVLVIRNGRAAIGINEDHHPHRQRFTVAHELAHYLLHRGASQLFIDSTLTFYRDETSADGIYEQEIEANAFAAALLMPGDRIREEVNDRRLDLYDERTILRLAERFAVSQQAFTIRLMNLGLVAV